jgi:sugar phosphate isomerase/epimerase
MKSAFVISVSATAFAAIAPAGDLEKKFAFLAGLGFEGVEIGVRDPALVEAERIRELAQKHGLAIAAIGTGQALVDEGLSFSDPDPAKRSAAIARVKRQLELGKKLAAQVIIGLIRGRGETGPGLEESRRLMLEALDQGAAYAEEIEAPGLLFEPINRYETRLVNSLEQGVALLKERRWPKVRLLADTFHMNLEDRDLMASLRQAGDLLGHVHLADSNRLAPGQGHTDFGAILSALREIGYAGWLAAEIMPLPTPEEAARRFIEFIQKFTPRRKEAKPQKQLLNKKKSRKALR